MENLFKDQQTLALFLIFFIPGFVSLKIYDLIVPGQPRDFSKAIFDTVAYSALNFIAMSWLIALMRSGQIVPILWYLSLVTVGIIAPVVWPLLLILIRRSSWASSVIPAPLPGVWDSVFEQRKERWVIVHMKNTRIGGFYGTCSFASSSPSPPEIYLEEVWHLDEKGAFVKCVDSTAGILIQGQEITAIEFFKV